MADVKKCHVTYTDNDGIAHGVDVEADSLYEAVGLAIARFKKSLFVSCEPGGWVEFLVEVREPGTQHRVGRKQFDMWMERRGTSPREITLRQKIRAALDKP